MVISRCAVALWSLALVETTMQAFSSGLLVPVVVDGNQVDFELAEPIESVEAIAAEAQRWCFRNGIEQEPGIGECVEALVERTIELLDQQQQVQVMPDGDSAAAQEAKPLFVVDVQLVWGEGENDRQVVEVPYMASQTPIEAALLHCSAAAVETMTEECVQKSAWAIAGQVAEMLLPYDRKGDLLYTVPVSVNGVEASLDVVQGWTPSDMAVPICLDPTVGLPSIEDYKQCIFYLAEVASEVLRMHYRKALGRQQDEELELDFDDMEGAANKEENVDPDLIFSVPIAIMDSILFAELRKGDTPPLAAEKFCTTNLESLTVALADRGMTAQDEQGLLEQCSRLVTNSILAVLQGLEERIVEAEMASNAATNFSKNATVVEIPVDLGDGEPVLLSVNNGETVAMAALNFLTSNGLDVEIAPELEQLITAHLKALDSGSGGIMI